MTLAPLGIPGKLSPTALALPEDLTYDQWEAVGGTLRLMEGAVQFWIGDWIRYGQRRYGEMYSQALDATDYEHGSLRNMVYVAEAIETSLRNDNLSWHHHKAVAPLEPEEQREMLDRAEAEGLSVAALRALINPKQDDPPKPLEPGQTQCPKCEFRFRLSENNHVAALTHIWGT
tara:strand:- start:1392 stop:1913 length:522 start_codon:yes stop_codon:yes gene_type:complete